ncbi:hypothetical protein DFJ74DRAFT_518680 [Hyaloraphidium curvatum]|nr:hypothetical protein DFJ74DRAFT_518680 [Hyaloraphidium curvatum]
MFSLPSALFLPSIVTASPGFLRVRIGVQVWATPRPLSPRPRRSQPPSRPALPPPLPPPAGIGRTSPSPNPTRKHTARSTAARSSPTSSRTTPRTAPPCRRRFACSTSRTARSTASWRRRSTW